MNVKIIICLALVFICLNEAVAQIAEPLPLPYDDTGLFGLERKGKGLRPCGGKDNIKECTCEDGETYPVEEVKESCVCVDESTWTRPERPCGGRKNITECVCQDGEKYSGKDIRKNCRPRKNPIETCTCEDGTTWTPPSKEEED